MLDNITVHDVILRLNNREKGVSALVGDNKDGWGTKIAWNPIESFKPNSEDPFVVADEFDKFVSAQKSLNRLVIGFITYDFGCLLQEVDLTSEDVLNLPGIHAYSYENWIEFSESGMSITGNSPEFADGVSELLKRDVSPTPKNLYKDTLSPIDSKSNYLDSFNKLKTYIKDGDVYQVNLSQWFEGSTDRSGKQIFSSLSSVSNSNFQAYIELGGKEILSFSPERFISVRDNKISTMPIKGTRPRGSSEQEDKFVADELYGNEKEKAELDMIIDLSRNDLGKICTPGSVKVSERRTISYHPTIIDAHGKVEGTLLDNVNSVQALISMMPGCLLYTSV